MGSFNCYHSSKQDSKHHRRTNVGTDSYVGYVQPLQWHGNSNTDLTVDLNV